MWKEIDTHVHTKRFSGDSRLDMEEILEQLSGRAVCITEHMDYGSYVKQDKKFCVENYLKDYAPFRNRGIYLGVEIGMDVNYSHIQKLENEDFDYIIGSVHALEGKNLYGNPGIYDADKHLFYKKYFRYTIQCLKTFPFIDSFAHFDYVSRYTPYKDPVLYYREFENEYKALFHTLLSHEILLEVNTRVVISRENLALVLKGYYEAGGRFVTLGSDAHEASGLFKNFGEINRIIRQSGLRRAFFVKRRMMIVTEVENEYSDYCSNP